ncbi:MAG TPA: circularly permuted type 2 ATP-grasp protein [Candidatus Limnocylindria bacterium]|nr:circularly permuted type 2 ATP-grasp protein [Candidatus Limnocylindria bacterium]
MNYPLNSDRYDEVFAAQGRPRAHWTRLAQAATRAGRTALSHRAGTIRRAVEQDGVTYNVYGDPKGTDRPWEVDLLPFVISAEEWQFLAKGLAQRARLLNLVLADLYGANRLLAEGLIPPAIIHGHHNYLWPCRSIEPPGGTFLHLYACDLARSPDGRWWVMGDRTQGPSGAGYAVQNRLIVTPLYENIFRSLGVQRLANFFRTLQQQLAALAPTDGEEPLVALLTAGPYNETYFEHVFLARYLGIPLVEGSDLTVRNNRVYLKTLQGLKRVHGLLRRLDDEYCDPASLRADSALGVAGLISAARAGNVLIANALGSGVIESPALLGFLPAICESLLGERLALPSVATWWCGEALALEHAIDHLPELVIKPVFPSMKLEPTFGHNLDNAKRAAMVERLRATPHAFVAQEWVRLSQAPAWSNESQQFEPRVVGLRLYATAKGDGYEVMPGGLARVAPESAVEVVTIQRGGSSKDVWVLGDGATPWQSLLAPRLGARNIVRGGFYSPSRAVENLFWLGRYTERVENVGRLLRAVGQRLAESDPAHLATLKVLTRLSDKARLREAREKASSVAPATKSPVSLGPEWVIAATGDPQVVNGVPANAARLFFCATQLRERMSLDHWRTVQRLAHVHEPVPQSLEASLAILDRLIPACTALAGYALDDMTRDDAWRFLVIGRDLERMAFLSSAAMQALGLPDEDSDGVLGALLEIGNVSMTYRARYQRHPELIPVLDLLVLDESNPHSVCFQMAALYNHLKQIWARLGFRPINDPASLLLALREFDLVELEDLRMSRDEPLAALLTACESCVYGLSDELTQRFFIHAGERPQTSVAA